MIAVHPSYVFSYAPAVVILVYTDRATVKFYDSTHETVSYSEMYKITQDMYDRSVEYIRKCEQKMVGSAAIVLNEQKGFYQISKLRLDTYTLTLTVIIRTSRNSRVLPNDVTMRYVFVIMARLTTWVAVSSVV